MQTSAEFTFGDFFDALPDEIVVLDSLGRICLVNSSWKKFCAENGGDTRSYYVGTNYIDICRGVAGKSAAEARLVPVGLRRTLEHGEAFRCEYPCHSPTEARWFELIATRLMHKGLPYAVVQHRNISIRKLESEQVSQAFLHSETLAALVATSNDAILSYDLEGRIATWNRGAEGLYGYTAQEAVGQPLDMLYPKDWKKTVSEYRDEILAGKLSSFEAVRLTKDGQPRQVWISAAPIRGVHGEVQLVSNIHRDVTEVRRAEKARDIIAQEVVHRAKNMLTVVSAIHRQTARSAKSLEEFDEKFGARIRALADSTDLLVSGNWTTVNLNELVRAQVGPFFGGAESRLTIEGPPIRLQPQPVQVIGMALHELSTNSAKHGALKTQEGRVHINWSLDGASAKMLFQWTEIGIPPLGDKRSLGFGNTVLTSLAQSMLDAEASFQLDDDGVRWTLAVPSAHVSLDQVH